MFRWGELSVCLFVGVLCVFVSPFLGNRLSLAKQAASKSAKTFATSTHKHHLHPNPPGEDGNWCWHPKVKVWSISEMHAHMRIQIATHKLLPTRCPYVHVCMNVGTSPCNLMPSQFSATKCKVVYIEEGKMQWKCCTSPAEVSFGDKPHVEVETWNMCLNRCPHSALQQYVLLPKSNKGQRGDSAQTYLHMHTVYSWVSANAVCKMDPNNRRCRLIKITHFPLLIISHICKQICSLCIDFMDPRTHMHIDINVNTLGPP